MFLETGQRIIPSPSDDLKMPAPFGEPFGIDGPHALAPLTAAADHPGVRKDLEMFGDTLP